MKKFFTLLFVLALAMPAYSAVTLLENDNTKLSMYSSIRLLGIYQNINKNGGSPQAGQNSDLVYALQGNSRLGLDFSTGGFFAKFELKFNPDNGGVGMFRQFYAGYKFDNGLKVTAGRGYATTETYLWYDNVFDTDNGMKGYGTIGVGRGNFLRLSLLNIDLTFLAMNNDPFALGGSSSGTLSNSTPVNATLKIADEVMPALELAYNLNFGPLKGKIFGFYSGVTIEASNMGTPTGPGTDTPIGTDTQREWINAAAAGLVLKYSTAGFSTVFSAFYALNGNYIGAVSWGSDDPTHKNSLKFKDGTSGPNTVWEGYDNINSLGAALSLGYDILDSLNVTVGGAFQSIFSDSPSFDGTGSLNSYAAYVAFKYSINKYFMIIPTVGYYVNYTGDADYVPTSYIDKNGKPQMTTNTRAELIAGAQLRISF